MMITNDFIDSVKFETVEYNNCSDFGCLEEGVCRCSVIESVILTEVDIRSVRSKIIRRIFLSGKNRDRNNTITQLLFGYDANLVLEYCVDRILSYYRIWNLENWSYTIDNGFYGEEVNSIFIQPEIFNKVIEHISEIEKFDDLRDIVFYLLNLEYGTILDKLRDKDYTIDYVEKSKIIFGQKSHLKKVKSKDLSYYHQPLGIRGIVLRQDENYFVIDGYHRLSASKSEKVLVIISE
jgi:hypothetical protein